MWGGFGGILEGGGSENLGVWGLRGIDRDK